MQELIILIQTLLNDPGYPNQQRVIIQHDPSGLVEHIQKGLAYELAVKPGELNAEKIHRLESACAGVEVVVMVDGAGISHYLETPKGNILFRC